MASNDMRTQIRGFQVVEDFIPISDHWPVSLQIQLNEPQQDMKTSVVKYNRPACNWRQCKDVHLLKYQRELDVCLSDLEIPLEAIFSERPDQSDHNFSLELFVKVL